MVKRKVKTPLVKKWTPKLEKFCQIIVSGKAVDQSDAYRMAYRVGAQTKAKTVHEKASRLMADDKVKARIAELMKPAVESVQMTKEEWMRGMERLVQGVLKSDTRKMYDSFGNPVEIKDLGDHEEVLIEGFEFVEDFTKVKGNDGTQDAVSTGYTKKVKLTPRLGAGIKAAIEFGKVMGWYTEKREIEAGATLEQIILASLEK